MTGSSEKILIACIGNLFLGDDGFGVEVARALAAAELPASVVLRDYGIRGFDLAYAMLEPWRAVILIDAIVRGGAPGTLYLLEPKMDAGSPAQINPHAMDPTHVLALAQSLGQITAPVFIIACEPQDFGHELEGRMGLSPAVEAAVPHAREMILSFIAQFAPTSILATSTAII